MMRWVVVLLCFFMMGYSTEEEKIVHVPEQLTVDMILANDDGYLNGEYFVRARLYDPINKERLWYEDFKNYQVENGSIVLTMNSIPLNEYYLYRKSLLFVVTVGDQTVEIPLLTELFSFRSQFAEFAWATRFPSLFHIDRQNSYVGIGNPLPKSHLDVGGSIKLGFEDTTVTGSIAWRDHSLQVKHPDAWVDLLYGPLTFKKSRWQEFSNHIELVTPNYSIGIGTKFPKEKLHVSDSAFFSGDVRAQRVLANSFAINNMELTNAGLKTSALYIQDSLDSMAWTPDRLRVSSGQVNGNGDGLIAIGNNGDSSGGIPTFYPNLIQSTHLDGMVISSRNLRSFLVSGHHLGSDFDMTRFETFIFNEAHISGNAIASDNIVRESLTIDMLITNNVFEYISDQIFGAEKIADNSVYNHHIGDSSIASFNIKLNQFGAAQFSNHVIHGEDHVTPNAILRSKLQPGQLSIDLFSGVLPLSKGGTGQPLMSSDRVLRLNATSAQFDVTTNMYVLSNAIGIYNDAFLDSLEISDIAYPLTVGSRSGSTNVFIRDSLASPVQLDLAMPSKTVAMGIDSSNQFSFDFGQHSLVLNSQMGVSFGQASPRHQFHIGNALTLGDTNTSEPLLGTMEYESDRSRFRFYVQGDEGNEWMVFDASSVTQLGVGIGQPVALNNDIHIEDSFVGAVANASGHLKSSMVGDIQSSHIDGEQISLSRVSNSTVHSHRLNGGQLINAEIHGEQLTLSDIRSSTINVDVGSLHGVESSRVHGRGVVARHVRHSGIDAQGSRVHHAMQLTGMMVSSDVSLVGSSFVNVHESVIRDSVHLSLLGQSGAVRHSNDIMVDGHQNHVMFSNQASILGNNNVASRVNDGHIVGEGNMLISSEKSMVFGDHNRGFGHRQRIDGEHNVAIGDQVNIHGDHNIVLNASDGPLEVRGDRQVVLSAPNGVYIHTGEGMVVAANAESGGWSMVSDRTLKTKFQQVNYQQMFEQLMALPVTTWEYSFNQGVQHIGPMAQDFNSTFKFGDDDRFITATDADGVAFSAIKHMIHVTDDLIHQASLGEGVSPDNVQVHLMELEAILDRLDRSIKMKKDALALMVDNNLKQYQAIDHQLKSLDALGDVPTQSELMVDSGSVIVLFFMAMVLGFYVVRLYHKKRNQ